jgi:hypothetical protein
MLLKNHKLTYFNKGKIMTFFVSDKQLLSINLQRDYHAHCLVAKEIVIKNVAQPFRADL